MNREIYFIRPTAYQEGDQFIVDVLLTIDQGEDPHLIMVDIGSMPESLPARDPAMVNHVRTAIEAAVEKDGFPAVIAKSMVAGYFDKHYPL